MLFLTERLVDARDSREAEAAADAFAHDMMRAACLPPDALAEMVDAFRDLGGRGGGVRGAFAVASRSRGQDRGREDGHARRFSAEPLLTTAEWRADRAICDQARPDFVIRGPASCVIISPVMFDGQARTRRCMTVT